MRGACSLDWSALDEAGVAQLVERNLPKVDVEGSNPFARSTRATQHGGEVDECSPDELTLCLPAPAACPLDRNRSLGARLRSCAPNICASRARPSALSPRNGSAGD